MIGNLNNKQDIIEIIPFLGESHKVLELKGEYLSNIENGFIIYKLALAKKGGKTFIQAFIGSNTLNGKGTGIWELDITDGYDGNWRKIPTLSYRSNLAHIQG